MRIITYFFIKPKRIIQTKQSMRMMERMEDRLKDENFTDIRSKLFDNYRLVSVQSAR